MKTTRIHPEFGGERLTLWERRTDSDAHDVVNDDGTADGLKPARDCFACAHAGFRDACRLMARMVLDGWRFKRADGSILSLLAGLELLIEYRAVDPVEGECPGFALADDETLRLRGYDPDPQPGPLSTPDPPTPKKKARKR